MVAMRRWIFKALVLLVVPAGFLGGLMALGQWALEQIRQRERYTIAFSTIECTPPQTMERIPFLEEVQYHGRLPDHLCLLDDDLGERLATGFARHPWVAHIREIDLKPPREIRVILEYRRPVLAIRTGKTLRAVDDRGILLPADAPVKSLPVYPGSPGFPTGPAGTPWGDPKVETMARSLKRPSP